MFLALAPCPSIYPYSLQPFGLDPLPLPLPYSLIPLPHPPPPPPYPYPSPSSFILNYNLILL